MHIGKPEVCPTSRRLIAAEEMLGGSSGWEAPADHLGEFRGCSFYSLLWGFQDSRG